MTLTTTCGGLQTTLAVDREAITVIRRAARALSRAGLDDTLDDVSDRLLKKGRLLETVVSSGEVTITLRPYAELALRELTDVARSREITVDTKVKLAREILAFGGF